MTAPNFNKLLLIIAMAACFSMIFLNESGAIGVALPQMQQALELSNNAVQWVMNSFLLTAAVLLLLGGKLSDHYGRRKMFLLGMLLFLFGSTVCGCAQNTWMILGGRVLQAIGASLVYPSGTALVSVSFPENEFSQAYGTIMGFAYFFVAFGPFVGGFFTQLLTWRWLFLINIPVSILCFILTLQIIPKDPPNTKSGPLDFKGLFIFMLGLGALIFALMQGASWGWSSLWTIGLFIISIISLITFIKVESRVTDPLLKISLFRNKQFMAGNVIFPCTAACFTALVFWAIWLQQTFNFSPMMAGVAMIPATVTSLFVMRWSGAWGGRVGPRQPVILGSCLLVIAMYWIALTAPAQNYWLLFGGLLIFGFATPLIIPNSIAVVVNAVDSNERGVASGVYLTLQHVAFSLGFAVVSAVITTYNNHHLMQYLQTSTYANVTLHQVNVLLAGKNIIPNLDSSRITTLKEIAVTIYTYAFSWGMAALGIFAVIGCIFSFVYIGKEHKQ